MFAIVKLQDIAAEATAKVSELLAEGYTFNFTSAGHQGEYFKVDLTRGDETLRVCVEPGYSCADGKDRSFVVLSIARYDIRFTADSMPLWNVGMKDTSSGAYPGTVVERHVWYKFGRGRCSGVYTDDLGAIESMEAVRHARREARRGQHDAYGTLTDEHGYPHAFRAAVKPETILPLVRKHRGYARATVDDIELIMRNNRGGRAHYTVYFKRRVSKTAEFDLVLGR